MAPTRRLIIGSTVDLAAASGSGVFDQLASKSRGNLYLIDSTIVKAHRAASGANVWPAPSASGFFGSGINSLHKRIRPFGYALLIRGTTQACEFHH
jgi:hypothetical protein